MALTPDERQRRYYERKQAARAQSADTVLCACGCGERIPAVTAAGNPARYKHGHNSGGEATRFAPGLTPWNAGIRGSESHSWKSGEFRVRGGYMRVRLLAEEAAQHPTAVHHKSRGWWSLARSHFVWNNAHPDDLVRHGNHVHHRNRVRDDDRIQNLVKMNAAEHGAASPGGMGGRAPIRPGSS